MSLKRYVIKAIEDKLFSIIDSQGHERIYLNIDDVLNDLREDLTKKPEWIPAREGGGHG